MNVKKSDRELAKEIYIEHKGKKPLVEIAEKIGRPPGTVRGWKSKDKWDSFINGTLQQKERNKTERSKEKKHPKSKAKKQEDKAHKSIIEKVISNTELTDKQQLFCIYYNKCFNATKAYQKAYGVDYITANAAGPRLLANVSVKEEIQRLKQSKLNRIMLHEDDIFQRYMDIAFADITDYVSFGSIELPLIDKNTNEPKLDKEGNPITTNISYVDLKDSLELDGTIISEVSKGKDGAKVKLHDKMKALQWLSDRMDLLPTHAIKKLEIETEKLEIEKLRNSEEVEVFEDDGFIDALRGEISEVWADEDTEED